MVLQTNSHPIITKAVQLAECSFNDLDSRLRVVRGEGKFMKNDKKRLLRGNMFIRTI